MFDRLRLRILNRTKREVSAATVYLNGYNKGSHDGYKDGYKDGYREGNEEGQEYGFQLAQDTVSEWHRPPGR